MVASNRLFKLSPIRFSLPLVRSRPSAIQTAAETESHRSPKGLEPLARGEEDGAPDQPDAAADPEADRVGADCGDQQEGADDEQGQAEGDRDADVVGATEAGPAASAGRPSRGHHFAPAGLAGHQRAGRVAASVTRA